MTHDKSKRPKVGITAFIWRDGRVIITQRFGSHGNGTWQCPGGHLEFGESWEEAVSREIREEIDVEVTNLRYLATTNDIFDKDDKHYITIWMECDWLSNEPESQEPEKIKNVQWCTLDNLPSPLFAPCYANLRAIMPDYFRPRQNDAAE